LGDFADFLGLFVQMKTAVHEGEAQAGGWISVGLFLQIL